MEKVENAMPGIQETEYDDMPALESVASEEEEGDDADNRPTLVRVEELMSVGEWCESHEWREWW